MQLASHGLRALKGTQAHSLPSSRSIHIPAFAPRVSPPTTSAQAVVQHARNLVSRFFVHLTTPGTLRSSAYGAAGGSRAVHMSAARMPTIQQRLSFPARHILSRPLAVPFLPRPPAVPRHISQVGLGTARNFSSSRPLFQHLIENVPVYARAFNEVDWEVRIEQERERLRMEKHKAKKEMKKAKKAMAPLRPLKEKENVALAPSAEPAKEELEHYFPKAAVPEVTTHLLIPLAPTPTARLPLPLNPPATSAAHPLLPLNVIAFMHASHGTHALRVSTVFIRLDTARVFDEPGVHCEARGDPSGLCTVLEVRFEGWTANKVRGVLGEAGEGWCVLEEVWRDQERLEAEEMDAALESLSEIDAGSEVLTSTSTSRVPSIAGLSDLNASWDATRSFVMPTLDFSASFGTPATFDHDYVSSPVQTPLSDLEFHNAWSRASDGSRSSSPGSFGSGLGLDEADWDAESVSSGSDWFELPSRPSSASASMGGEEMRFGFSSRFSERMGGAEGPREELF